MSLLKVDAASSQTGLARPWVSDTPTWRFLRPACGFGAGLDNSGEIATREGKVRGRVYQH